MIDNLRHNGLAWNAFLSFEGFGVYRLLLVAYQREARMLLFAPEDCLMVACRPFDLDAAAQMGVRTALIWRSDGWGVDEAGLPEIHLGGTMKARSIACWNYTQNCQKLSGSQRLR